MRAAARWLSILLTVAAAALAALVVVPPPSQPFALLAIVVDEKTFLLIAAALVAAALARASASRLWLFAQALLAIAIVSVSLLPPAQAVKLAGLRHVTLDWGRYLTAPIDNGAAHPSRTLIYATVDDGHALALDVYRPPASKGPVPAVVVLHGGGWTAGDKGEAPLASAALAARGFAVFDVQYRLAPPPTWQAAVGDVKCAVGWVKRHARQSGVDVDPARVFLLGRSAGAHLALLAAYTPGDATLPASCDAGDTHVAGVISLYGVSDLPWGWEHHGNPRVFDVPGRMTQYVGAPFTQAPDRYHLLSPVERVTAAAPPTLLIHGGRDAFVSVDQVDRLASKLTALGVAHDVLVIPYAQHAFDFIAGGLAEQLAENAILRFLGIPPVHA